MKTLLILAYLFADGTNEIVPVVLDSYAECAYTQAILINDYSYFRWNPLKASTCIKLETD